MPDVFSLLGRRGHRIVGMGGPVAVFLDDLAARALIAAAGRQLLHGDAVFDRADIDTEIAADAFRVDHLEMPLAVDRRRDGLVRGVLAGDIPGAIGQECPLSIAFSQPN